VPSQHTGKKISDEQRSLGKENKILKGNKKIVLDPRGIVGRQFCIFWNMEKMRLAMLLAPKTFGTMPKTPSKVEGWLLRFPKWVIVGSTCEGERERSTS
jgi:hypothetical protein